MNIPVTDIHQERSLTLAGKRCGGSLRAIACIEHAGID
jgi:hypothetical protein